MSINAGKIITIYGKQYFDILYNDTKEVKYCYKAYTNTSILTASSDITTSTAINL